MGLAGARKRVKINNDPNNTQWARSTSNYGHRMLVSQGWQPGGVLGSADNPDYSDHHLTEASKSHIKAMLREDNLGLGAKKGSGQEAGECVGLDAFQGLLGRLNGKSDDALAKEQKSRDDLKRARYMELRGTVRFVRGGTLVSDMDELIELARRSRIDMKARTASLKASAEEQAEDLNKKKHRKERRAIDSEAALVPMAIDDVEDSLPIVKEKKKKSKKRRNKEMDVDSSRQEDDIPTFSQRSEALADVVSSTSSSLEQPDDEEEVARNARRKAEKAEKRERKQRKKEERAARKAQSLPGITTIEIEGPKVEEVIKETIIIDTVPKPSTTTTAAVTTVRQASLGGRHMSVRSRYIAAKRRAVMDPQALKEILMVKA